MKLSHRTRHALRVLAHLAASSDRLMPIGDIAQACGISHNNLMKVAQDLRMAGFIDAVRGRCGGIRLARPAGEITLGELVLHTERTLALGDSAWTENAPVAQTETQVFEAAFASFFATLDGFTLADVAQQQDAKTQPSRPKDIANKRYVAPAV